jgi:protein FAM32A
MFTGGKLSFKGGVGPAVKKKSKKKSKSKSKKKADAEKVDGGVVATDAAEAPQAAAEAPQAAAEAPDALVLLQQHEKQQPVDAADTRTDAEKRREAHMAKYEKERAKKAASKSHRERIAEMNKYLEGLSEHHDIPKTSYSYM